MSAKSVRSRGFAPSVVLGGAIAAAVIGMGTANAQNSDLASVLIGSLGDVSAVADHDLQPLIAELGVPNSADFSTATLASVSANLIEGIDLLEQLMLDDPDAGVPGSVLGVQNQLLASVDRLQDAQDNISAHLGSLAPTIENLFFDPLNQYWLSGSESVLAANNAFVDAVLADLDRWDILDARAGMTLANFELTGASILSVPVVYFSDFLDLFGGS